MATTMQSIPGAACDTAEQRSVVNVAIPQCRGKWLPMNAIFWIDPGGMTVVMAPPFASGARPLLRARDRPAGFASVVPIEATRALTVER
jgi:hypothetical protein